MLDSVAVEEHRCVREDVHPLLTVGVVSLACPFLILSVCKVCLNNVRSNRLVFVLLA